MPNESLRLFNDLVERGRAGVKTAPTPEQHAPNPVYEDYKRGWFVRYFVRKTNDQNAPVLEVDETQFNALKETLYFLKSELRWRIHGSYEAVGETNYKTLAEVEFYLPGITARLPNLHQFWKGE